MHGYHLQDEFIDSAAEQALIAAVIHKPTLYFEFLDILAPDVFATEAATWREVALAIEADQPPLLSAPWRPSTDPQATAQRLADLYQRRLLAAAQERLAQALYDDTTPASTLAVLLEEEALRVQAALRATAFSRLQWASDLLPEVLAEAAERRRQWEETGIPVQGLSTGITHLNDLLNGLNEGLYLLGGPPGMGKTTLAWQLATHVARDTPVVFVTFEHAPTNLLLKALCARAGVNPQDVQRGQADLTLLLRAATAWQPSAQRLALIEGSSRLTVAQVRAHTLQAMHRHQAPRCLVVVDYLQLWAKVAEDLRGSFQVRERVELLGGALRELAMHLQSPVLALVVAKPRRRALREWQRLSGLGFPQGIRRSGVCGRCRAVPHRSSGAPGPPPSACGRSRGRQEPARGHREDRAHLPAGPWHVTRGGAAVTPRVENLTMTGAELAACQPIAGEGGYVLRALCPFHGSDHQRSLRVTVATGRFVCFACGAWGYLAEARERWQEEQQRQTSLPEASGSPAPNATSRQPAYQPLAALGRQRHTHQRRVSPPRHGPI